MHFNLRLDSGALVNLDGVKQAATGVDVTDSDLVVNLGTEFQANINRSSIARAEAFPDPRPGVYFPMGLSSAVNQIGPDTVCVVTSYDGLVKVDLNQQVEGQGRFIEPERPAGSQQRDNTPIPTPPSGWWSLARVVGIIVILVVLYQLLSHGLGWLVLLLIVLLILGLIGRSVMTSMQQRSRKAASVSTERAPIPFRHLVVSVDDPQGLIRALNQRGGGSVAARPAQ
jgi:hypothetical protein